jgi:hypothetical protein
MRTCKTIILPVVLNAFETLSATLREEHRLRVFEKKIAKEDIWTEEGLGNGRWRKLHNEELRDLYTLPSTVRRFKSSRMRWARHVA